MEGESPSTVSVLSRCGCDLERTRRTVLTPAARISEAIDRHYIVSAHLFHLLLWSNWFYVAHMSPVPWSWVLVGGEQKPQGEVESTGERSIQ